MGTIPMKDRHSMLAAVTVEGDTPPVTMRHDTLEFNAGSFRTKPDAVVEDLLKKLPGVSVDRNGTIKANGEQVKKVLVDGKEFFGNDPKIATKNLPADVVDKVQVFDKKSDQSQFTGFDDGNSQKTINLTIKKDRKNGIFGKATAGYGDENRYEEKINAHQFSRDRQLSVLGMANNTNKQGFSFQDVLNFNGGMPGGSNGNGASFNLSNTGVPVQDMMDNNHAITTTLAGGVNFNDTWHDHTNVSGNYFYNGTDDRVDQKEHKQFLLPANSFQQDGTDSIDRHNTNQRITLISDQRVDSFNSLKITSAFIYQKSHSASKAIDTSKTTDSGVLLNERNSNTYSYANGYNWNSTALLRHRFAKKGRTLSINLSFGLNNNDGGGNLYSRNDYYKAGNLSNADTLNQVYDQSGNTHQYGAVLSYTEPLSRRSLLELNYSFYQNRVHSDKHTFDADRTGKYTLPNAQLTNDFENSYTYHREGIRFRHQRRQYNFTVGSQLELTSSNNRFSYLNGDSTLRRSFVNFLPDANFQYEFNKYRSLRGNYTTYTNQPTLSQLQPVPDNSDPLNIRTGNPQLKQEYYHSLRMNYVAFDPFRRTSFFAMASFTGIHGRIVNDDRIDSNGVRNTRPVNLNGLYRLNTNLAWELPLRAIRSMLNLSGDLAFNHTASLINGVRNTGNTLMISQGADLNFSYKERLDISGGIRVDYNDAHYSLQPAQNQRYWTETYTFDANGYLPGGFSIASDLDYIHRSGLAAGYNSSPIVWNAGMAKKVFHSKKGELRLQIFDILRQNTGFSRNTNQNYIDDVSYRVLNRYWQLSFTYNISRFAGKSIQGAREPGNINVKIMK